MELRNTHGLLFSTRHRHNVGSRSTTCTHCSFELCYDGLSVPSVTACSQYEMGGCPRCYGIICSACYNYGHDATKMTEMFGRSSKCRGAGVYDTNDYRDAFLERRHREAYSGHTGLIMREHGSIRQWWADQIILKELASRTPSSPSSQQS